MADAAGEVPRFEDVAARAEPLASYRSRQPLDDAVILYTSGTTGSPKGAVLTQNNLVLNATIGAYELCRSGPEDVYLAALPLFHAFGQTTVMNAGFRAGSKIQLLPRFDAKAALETMLLHEVTVFAGVPDDVHRFVGSRKVRISPAAAAARDVRRFVDAACSA